MKIQPVNTASCPNFKGDDTQSNIGKTVGFVAGAALGGALLYSQIKSLKTIDGKRNLIEGFHAKDKTLNDIMKHETKRNADGKIIPPLDGVSERSKKIVKDFKKTLVMWGATITALTTGLGAIADNSITAVNEKEKMS